MFAPNGQQCQLNQYPTVTSGRVQSLLADSHEALDYSASFNRVVCFELSDEDVCILQGYYPETSNKIILFKYLVGQLLEYYEFIHRLKDVYSVVGTNRFYCVFRLANVSDLDF